MVGKGERGMQLHRLEKGQVEQIDDLVRVSNYDLSIMKRWQCNDQHYKNLHGFCFIDLLGNYYDIIRYVTATQGLQAEIV